MKTRLWVDGEETSLKRVAADAEVSCLIVQSFISRAQAARLDSFKVAGIIVHLSPPSEKPPVTPLMTPSTYQRQLEALADRYTDLILRLDDDEDKIKALRREVRELKEANHKA